MSAAQTVREIYSAWNAGDWALDRFDPHVESEVKGKSALDQAGTIRGREALAAYWRSFWAAWKTGGQWKMDEVISVGDDQVLASGVLHAVGRASGVSSDVPVVHLWTLADGVVVRLVVFDDREAALAEVAP